MIFELHNEHTVKEAALPHLQKVQEAFGFVPNLQKVMAESPALLQSFLTVYDIFSNTDFTPEEKQIIYLSISYENECQYCMAGHSMLASHEGVPVNVTEALRGGQSLQDKKLEALRKFTSQMVTGRGWVDKSDIEEFFNAGYTKQSALDIILGIAFKVMSNYTNNLAATPLDVPFQPSIWKHPRL